MPAHYTNFQFRDYSSETSNARFYNGAVTVASLPGYLTAIGTGRAAVDGITDGVVAQESWVGDLTVLSAAKPSNMNSQRERKWLVRYHDTVTAKKYKLEIPTADPTGRLLADSDFADLANAEIAAFVTWFNTFARSTDNDTNAVLLDSMQLVGRNL